MRLSDWIPGVKARRAHAAAWDPELDTDTNGFTVFALRAEKALRAGIVELGVEIEHRIEHGTIDASGRGERWIEMHLREIPITIWIYADQIDVSSPALDFRLEHWDAASPNQARALALRAIIDAVAQLQT